jgi:hypothetical protein
VVVRAQPRDGVGNQHICQDVARGFGYLRSWAILHVGMSGSQLYDMKQLGLALCCSGMGLDGRELIAPRMGTRIDLE